MPEFSRRSLDKLIGVHEDLVNLCLRAVHVSEVDFSILQGRRTQEEQARVVAAGASQTMQSKHLIGHAVDVGAWVGGGVVWDWYLYPRIARAFRQASIDLSTGIVWGGVWDRQLATLDEDLDAEVGHYKARRHGKAFLDGGHFELHFDPGVIA